MIAIVTHNGEPVLKNLLDDISSFNVPNNEVCVVDNLSTTESHLLYLEKLKNEGYNVLHNPDPHWEIGAFKYAIENIKSDVWFCMQDSIHIKQDIFSYVTPKLTENNVYTFLTGPCGLWDDHNDKFLLNLHFGTMTYSKVIFGNMMFAKNSVLQRVKDEWFIPSNRTEAAASERGVSVVFDRHNIKIIGLGYYDPPKTGDPNGYPFFQKIYTGRA
jgi:GT2 family glycosyltransferase